MPKASSLIQLLLARLERISADSPLAHRASGVRGALLRAADDESLGREGANTELKDLVDAALDILTRAAAELGPGRGADR